MLIIITACIKPSTLVKNIAIRDDKIRLQQYIDTINFFLESESITDIIFCDNSNFNFNHDLLYKKAKLMMKNLEILQFKQDDTMVTKKGKSYGEVCIMDYILKNSNLIKNHHFFFKITGRLVVKNFNCIARNVKQSNNYFVYLGNPVNSKSKKIDTRFYAMTISDYVKLKDKLYNLVDESKGFTLEKSFFYGIKQSCVSFKLLPYYPEYIGISGSTGINYNNANLKKLKIMIKNILIKICDTHLKAEE